MDERKTADWIDLEMDPKGGPVDIRRTALVIIDMQRDFLEPGGFGEALGNDVSKLQRAVEPCRAVLEAARAAEMLVIHTREGHRPEMTDLTEHKKSRSSIGVPGPMGLILLRGEPGQDIIPRLYPEKGEPVLDKPGKGSFYATDLELMLRARSINTLLVCGVTTEVCVHTTVREANDRGFHCLVVSDACASYNDEFHSVALKMISAQGGIFGNVTSSEEVVRALKGITQ